MSHRPIASLLTRTHRLLSRPAAFTLLALTIAAAGCKPVGSNTVTPPGANSTSDNASVMSDSVNYRHDREIKYTLYDLSQQPPMAIGGAIVTPLATGGAKGCCIALPKTWKPGMKVKVVWGEADQQIYPEEYTRELEIPRYDAPADLYVIFYPEYEVDVVVSAASPGHPEWQGKNKKTPWAQCVESHGLKACKAVLPKQFDTGAKGFCVYLQEEWPGDKEKQEACESQMILCMLDYEDEAFCRNILWGEPCTTANKEHDPYCIAREKRLREKNTK